jgi:NADPH2:quinone reductase
VPQAQLIELPEGVDYDQAAARAPAGADRDGAGPPLRPDRAGETIVVEAAGRRHRHARRAAGQARRRQSDSGLASSEEKRELVRGLGADACVDSRAEDLGAAIREANDGKRVDAVCT